MPETPRKVPRKGKIKESQLAALLQYSEILIAQHDAQRRVLERRKSDKSWRDDYDRVLPEIQRKLEPVFHALHAHLREWNTSELFRILIEELGKQVDDDE